MPHGETKAKRDDHSRMLRFLAEAFNGRKGAGLVAPEISGEVGSCRHPRPPDPGREQPNRRCIADGNTYYHSMACRQHKININFWSRYWLRYAGTIDLYDRSVLDGYGI